MLLSPSRPPNILSQGDATGTHDGPAAQVRMFSEHPNQLSDVQATDRSIPQAQLAPWLLRGGLAFVLAYAATAMAFNPAAFVSYVPGFIRASHFTTAFLFAISGLEILLTVGLLWRRFTYIASVLSAALMVMIVSCNFNEFDVLFRNVAVACGALSLALQIRNEDRVAAL